MQACGHGCKALRHARQPVRVHTGALQERPAPRVQALDHTFQRQHLLHKCRRSELGLSMRRHGHIYVAPRGSLASVHLVQHRRLYKC